MSDYLKLSTVPIAVVGAGGSSRGGSLCFCFKKSEMPLKTNIVAILWEPSATKMPRLRRLFHSHRSCAYKLSTTPRVLKSDEPVLHLRWFTLLHFFKTSVVIAGKCFSSTSDPKNRYFLTKEHRSTDVQKEVLKVSLSAPSSLTTSPKGCTKEHSMVLYSSMAPAYPLAGSRVGRTTKFTIQHRNPAWGGIL